MCEGGLALQVHVCYEGPVLFQHSEHGGGARATLKTGVLEGAHWLWLWSAILISFVEMMMSFVLMGFEIL